jgi:hypothetical protein
MEAAESRLSVGDLAQRRNHVASDIKRSTRIEERDAPESAPLQRRPVSPCAAALLLGGLILGAEPAFRQTVFVLERPRPLVRDGLRAGRSLTARTSSASIRLRVDRTPRAYCATTPPRRIDTSPTRHGVRRLRGADRVRPGDAQRRRRGGRRADSTTSSRWSSSSTAPGMPSRPRRCLRPHDLVPRGRSPLRKIIRGVSDGTRTRGRRDHNPNHAVSLGRIRRCRAV